MASLNMFFFREEDGIRDGVGGYLMPGQNYAFEPFASLDGVLRGEPIRIMPAGVFYRGERKLNITEDRLKAIAANFKASLPPFRVPINENHAGVGKVGQ